MRRHLALVTRIAAGLLALASVLLTSGCVSTRRAAPAPLLLVSMDGFRWDYLQLYPESTPHLRQLAREGVHARGLIPVFPSNTFPGHYAIATGLYPSHSGMLNNRMFDANLGEFFQYNVSRSAQDKRWWGGEPIWITAVKQGHPSACSFWPGSETEIQGVRPTYWKPYDTKAPFEGRLEELVQWLTLPPEKRPAVVTFYLEETNSVGHKFGPRSPEVAAVLKQMDDRIAAIQQRLQAAGDVVNLVLVSDHGMTECGADRVVVIDDFIPLDSVQVDFDESSCGLRPKPGVALETVLAQAKQMPHVRVYRAEELPARWHIDVTSPRVPPLWIVPDLGWNILRRAGLEKVRPIFSKGQHGYDPALEAMHGLFIAQGPAFRRGVELDPVEQVHVYNLLCAAAGLTPARNDGDNRLVRAALK